jgi:hypothetical protein
MILQSSASALHSFFPRHQLVSHRANPQSIQVMLHRDDSNPDGLAHTFVLTLTPLTLFQISNISDRSNMLSYMSFLVLALAASNVSPVRAAESMYDSLRLGQRPSLPDVCSILLVGKLRVQAQAKEQTTKGHASGPTISISVRWQLWPL